MKPTETKASQVATIKVPAEFASELREHVARNGMTILGAFRAHGDRIIEVINGEKPRRKPAAAS